jgi:hypothetical protein
MTPYYELPGFEALYLEDSYVLDVRETGRAVIFVMDFVLTRQRQACQPPKPNEQYCYHRGQIEFVGPETVNWMRREFRPTTDPDGSVDYGNIEIFQNTGTVYQVAGEWGEVHIGAAGAVVALY